MPTNRIEQFDEFMKYLEELEKVFNSYGRSLKTFRESIKSKRGLLTEIEITKMKSDLESRLETIKENAQAFDAFQEFYKKTIEELTKYDLIWTVDPKYLTPKNRTTIDKEEINKKMKEAKETLIDLIREKNASLKLLEQELAQKGKQLPDYLTKLGVSKETIGPKEIDKIRGYSILEEQIKPLGITVEQLLEKLNKSLKDLSIEELEIISNNVKEHIKELNSQPLPTVDNIDFLDLDDDTIRKIA